MKQRLCDDFNEWIIDRVQLYSHSTGSTSAWLVNWHLGQDWGYPTAKINYELNKLVKEGKLLKRASRFCTEYSPIEVPGLKREGDKFIRLNPTS